ncbi:MAG: putative toxin-antitoxin system toxin component, PIN family [Proteobacteria bacterium]|nr:putative toxin-antitoxin system toxin component, PIN family [Pseudomonadota bacterium]
MTPQRIVLDTNVCLDLFVFDDPRCAALHAALNAGAIEAVTCEDCRHEWQIVLDYPHLPLDAGSKARAAARFDALIVCLPPGHADGREAVALPLCRDSDDQKFLELARDAQATVLITKDKALLKLAKRTARANLFRILTPQDWQHESTSSTG